MAQDCMHAGPDGSSTTSTTGAGLTLLGQRHSVLVRREILGANGPVPLRRLPVHHFPVMRTQHRSGVVGFFGADRNTTGCPAMSACRRSEVGARSRTGRLSGESGIGLRERIRVSAAEDYSRSLCEQ